MTMRGVPALTALSPEAARTTLAAATTTLSLRVPLRIRLCSIFDGNEDQGLDELLVDIVSGSSGVVVEDVLNGRHPLALAVLLVEFEPFVVDARLLTKQELEDAPMVEVDILIYAQRNTQTFSQVVKHKQLVMVKQKKF